MIYNQEGFLIKVMVNHNHYAKWQPHIHSLVTVGLLLPSGTFDVMPCSCVKPLAKIFRVNMLKMQKKEDLIVDNSVWIKKAIPEV